MELTEGTAFDTDTTILKGVGATVHQGLYPPKVIFAIPRTVKYPKVNPVRQVQQLARGGLYPSSPTKLKGPSQRWGGWISEGGIIVIVAAYFVTCYVQVFEKGEGTDKLKHL
jgi:hypothetical protein